MLQERKVIDTLGQAKLGDTVGVTAGTEPQFVVNPDPNEGDVALSLPADSPEAIQFAQSLETMYPDSN